MVQALIGGDLQGGSGASNAVINAVLNGAPIVAIGGTANRPYHRLFVQPEINRLEDLKGKTLGVTRFGSITDNLTRILLRKYGLENSVNVRQMGGTLKSPRLFKIARSPAPSPAICALRHRANRRFSLQFVDLGIPYSMNMLAVSRDYLRRDPDTAEKIVRAYAEGVAFMNQNKENAL